MRDHSNQPSVWPSTLTHRILIFFISLAKILGIEFSPLVIWTLVLNMIHGLCFIGPINITWDKSNTSPFDGQRHGENRSFMGQESTDRPSWLVGWFPMSWRAPTSWNVLALLTLECKWSWENLPHLLHSHDKEPRTRFGICRQHFFHIYSIAFVRRRIWWKVDRSFYPTFYVYCEIWFCLCGIFDATLERNSNVMDVWNLNWTKTDSSFFRSKNHL